MVELDNQAFLFTSKMLKDFPRFFSDPLGMEKEVKLYSQEIKILSEERVRLVEEIKLDKFKNPYYN